MPLKKINAKTVAVTREALQLAAQSFSCFLLYTSPLPSFVKYVALLGFCSALMQKNVAFSWFPWSRSRRSGLQLCNRWCPRLMFSTGACFIGSKQGDSSELVGLLMCTEGLSHSTLTILQEGALLSYAALNLLISFWGYLYYKLSAWATCLVKQWTSLGHVDGRAGGNPQVQPLVLQALRPHEQTECKMVAGCDSGGSCWCCPAWTEQKIKCQRSEGSDVCVGQ